MGKYHLGFRIGLRAGRAGVLVRAADFLGLVGSQDFETTQQVRKRLHFGKTPQVLGRGQVAGYEQCGTT